MVAAPGLAPGVANAEGFGDLEQALQLELLAAPLGAYGRVVDEHGYGLPGAQLRLIAWGDNDANDGEATTSWAGGNFRFIALARRNALLEVSLEGYYTEVIPLDLQRGLDELVTEIGEIELVARKIGRVRLSFAGDAMFGRRFFDDEVLAHETLEDDTKAVFRFVEPLLAADDHTAINLECPVTAKPNTPHPTKTFVFHSFPPSATALPSVGVDSVSLGNNHVFDYLSAGVLDTLTHLDAIGLPHYGAGMNLGEAAASAYTPTVNGVALALQGFSGISGASYGKPPLHIIALDDPPKAGALHSNAASINQFVDAAVAAGQFAIPIFHGGFEYEYTQSAASRADFARAVDRGAGLVIAHHPHVVHGVQLIETGGEPRFVFGSLGNFIFDQQRLETVRTYLVIVDIADQAGGPAVERVRLAPLRIDGYVPRLMAGGALAKLGRHVAHLSTMEAAESGFRAAHVFAEGGRLVVAPSAYDLVVTDLIDARTPALVAGTTGPIPLLPYTDTDALAALASDKLAICELGRDLLGVGDFEEPDVDDRYQEGDHWSGTNHVYVQSSEVRSGVGAAVILRRGGHQTAASLRFTSRVAVTPGRALSFHGWHTGTNVGMFWVDLRWLDPSGDTLHSEMLYFSVDNHWGWSSIAANTKVPAEAASVQLALHHHPPLFGEGRVVVDDLSLIEWAPQLVTVAGGTKVELATPNGWDFVRCKASGNSLGLTLTHRVYATR
jgi:poly-gamma-glutamate capsule biosynthesis protein CapA/YwtB (metallophosphatase superfamily)